MTRPRFFLMALALLALGSWQATRLVADGTATKTTETKASDKPTPTSEAKPSLPATATSKQAEKQADTKPAESKSSATPPQIEALLQQYAAAFNKSDAAGIAKLWTEAGEYIDRNDDSRTAGRAALEAGLQAQFKEDPAARITVTVKQTRSISPDVMSVEGESKLQSAGNAAEPSTFSALVVRHGDQWLFDRVEESRAATPESSHAALEELSWMIGQWKDETPGAQVDTTVRWSDSQAFLIRSFSVKTDDMDAPRRGTQVIGWDAKNKQIRSWTFDADGSFGQGTWSKNGNDWLVRMRYTLADGSTSSATQVITKVDSDNITVQSIAQELDGEPQPASPVIKVVRTADTDTDSVGSK